VVAPLVVVGVRREVVQQVVVRREGAQRPEVQQGARRPEVQQVVVRREGAQQGARW